MNNSEIKSFAELKKQNEIKKNLKLKLYNQFLNLILRKITNISQMLNQNYLIHQIPNVVVGYPFYNIDDCCNWLKEKLLSKGVNSVSILENNILFINWKLD